MVHHLIPLYLLELAGDLVKIEVRTLALNVGDGAAGMEDGMGGVDEAALAGASLADEQDVDEPKGQHARQPRAENVLHELVPLGVKLVQGRRRPGVRNRWRSGGGRSSSCCSSSSISCRSSRGLGTGGWGGVCGWAFGVGHGGGCRAAG